MVNGNNNEPTVIRRPDRGLTVNGTRITLYFIMDLIYAQWPQQLIQDRLNLTDKQITDVMAYIEAHRAEVEAEYQLVLQQAEENRRYWEERNRERFAEIAQMGPLPGKEEAWKKLQAKKKELGLI
jgi:hypothetical protein